MSKFLKIVEANRPLTSQELDKVTPIKRFIQRAFLSDESGPMLEDLGLERVIVTDRSNDIIFKFNDGVAVIYKAEIIKEEEEGEVIAAAEVGKDIDKNIGGALTKLKQKVGLKAGRIVPKLKELESTIDKF